MAKLPSARKRSIWVKGPTSWVKIKTRTTFGWKSTRDTASEDYQDAPNKVTYAGGNDITGSMAISRAESDEAYDVMQAAHFANTELEVQERDADNKVCIATSINVQEWTIDNGLNESSKVGFNYSVASAFIIYTTPITPPAFSATQST